MIDIFSFHGIFHLICFGLLLYCIQTFFKRYVITYLKEGVVEQEKFLESLREKIKLIKQQKKTVFDAGLVKRKEMESLLIHVQTWAYAVKKGLISAEQEKIVSQERVKEYQSNQMKGLGQLYAQKRIMPHALEQAEQELKASFSTLEQQKQFLSKAVIALKRNADE